MAEWTNDPGRGAADRAADADPAALRADIRNTRDRVGDTLEQLGERLNPNHLKEQVREQVLDNVTQLKDQVRETIRDATIGRVEHMAQNAANRVNATRHSMADTIRENPIPAAMVGLGLGWLFMNRRQDTDDTSRGSMDYQGGRSNYAAPRMTSGESASGSQSYGGSGGRESGAVDQARERVNELGHTVRDSAGQLADRAQDAAGAVADRAQHMASSVADQTRHQARRVEDRFHESPLAVGAATLALGLAAGLALPATHREVELMGDARDRFMDRAKEAAHDTTEKVQQVAGRVMDEAQSAAPKPSQPAPSTPAPMPSTPATPSSNPVR